MFRFARATTVACRLAAIAAIVFIPGPVTAQQPTATATPTAAPAATATATASPAATPTATAEAAPAAAPAPIDRGDHAWMLTSAALVLFSQ